MNTLFKLFVIYFVQFISNHGTLVSGDYKVNSVVPSYLYRNFENVKENIFPQDLRIKVSLTRIAGTLLYTIDKNMNQMIVTLHDGLSITLGIEFRKKEIFIMIPELCNCELCRFESLDIKIEIKDNLYIQCNTGTTKTYPYDNIVSINEAYNLPPKYNISGNISSSNEGYLWVVNTPYDTGIYPNQNQLEGCIFDVWYKDKPIIFQENVGNISNHCPSYCKGNICNGGDCFETYNGYPSCNCTKTFLNGIYCNETISQLNIRSFMLDYQFVTFKLSWNSSSSNILEMSNSQFRVRVCTADRILRFEYHYWKEYNVNITSILSQRYTTNKEYILIAVFKRRSIEIQYFNGSWSKKSLPSVSDLSKEKITSISLESGDGRISLAYKSNLKYMEWNILNLKNFEEIRKSLKNNKNFMDIILKGVIDIRITSILFIFFFLLFGILGILYLLFIRWLYKIQTKELSKEVSDVAKEAFKDPEKEFSEKEIRKMEELIRESATDPEKEFSEKQTNKIKELVEKTNNDPEKVFSPRQITKMEELLDQAIKNTDKPFSRTEIRKLEELLRKLASDLAKEFSQKQITKMEELMMKVALDPGQEFSETQKTTMKELIKTSNNDPANEFSKKQTKKLKEIISTFSTDPKKEFSEKQISKMRELIESISRETAKEGTEKLIWKMEELIGKSHSNPEKELSEKEDTKRKESMHKFKSQLSIDK